MLARRLGLVLSRGVRPQAQLLRAARFGAANGGLLRFMSSAGTQEEKKTEEEVKETATQPPPPKKLEMSDFVPPSYRVPDLNTAQTLPRKFRELPNDVSRTIMLASF